MIFVDIPTRNRINRSKTLHSIVARPGVSLMTELQSIGKENIQNVDIINNHRKTVSYDNRPIEHKHGFNDLQTVEDYEDNPKNFHHNLSTTLFCFACCEPITSLGVSFEPCNHTCCCICLINSLTLNQQKCKFCNEVLTGFKSVNMNSASLSTTRPSTLSLSSKSSKEFSPNLLQSASSPDFKTGNGRSSFMSIWSPESPLVGTNPTVCHNIRSPPIISNLNESPWPVIKIENVPWVFHYCFE